MTHSTVAIRRLTGVLLLVTAQGPDGPIQLLVRTDLPGVTVTPTWTLDLVRRTARIEPRASMSLAQMMPVIPFLISRVVTDWPPSSPNIACSTAYPGTPRPAAAHARTAQRDNDLSTAAERGI